MTEEESLLIEQLKAKPHHEVIPGKLRNHIRLYVAHRYGVQYTGIWLGRSNTIEKLKYYVDSDYLPPNPDGSFEPLIKWKPEKVRKKRIIKQFNESDIRTIVKEWSDDHGYIDFETAVMMLQSFQKEVEELNQKK